MGGAKLMSTCHPGSGQRKGFTAIELTVTIAVLAVLTAIALPAVQSSRESARQVQCRDQLRQIGVAVQSFESAHRQIPGNGWGYLWIGDPDRGVGKRQPGGWIYQLLPYVEGGALASLGRSESPAVKYVKLSTLIEQRLPIFRCPSRPGDSASAANRALRFQNAFPKGAVAKTDYAINEGDFITDTGPGPATLSEGDHPAYAWTDVSKATGVSFQRSAVRLQHIRDGLSHTYLVGEKYVSIPAYASDDDSDRGHDAPMYSGVDLDINRWTIDPPLRHNDGSEVRRFGSAHSGGCHFVLCDGTVRQVSYSIDRNLHRNLGNRMDGNVTEF